MTGKLMKDQDMQTPLDPEANKLEDSIIIQDEVVMDSEEVNSKGGETSDEGLNEYEVGYFESINLDDTDDNDPWVNVTRRSETESTDRI